MLFLRGTQLIQCRLQFFKLLCRLFSFFRAADLQFCLLTVQLSADILFCVIQLPAKFFNISALVVFLIIQRPYDIFCRFLCFLTSIFRGSVQVGNFIAYCFQTLFFRGLQLIQCRLQHFKLLCRLFSFFRAAGL